MHRYVAQVKEEVNREVRFQELQQLQQEIQAKATRTQSDFQREVDHLSESLPKSPEDLSDLSASKHQKDQE
jgi:sec-independent protein translocase protein TatB